ncbi:alpha/beta fold hydrolase [Couchioplanes caeruleus]|uniref:Hydrolase n=2 Tax=Couchioplanes caeruleus TaxID=56438 RepID=A0A1K0FT82_9ACTN|nr:alpha/beta fold hydrolase [Couchioplanes caeruleus]OJF11203.1 hydrolase [Couchioplanes caeruleus subsp. caeruleus]OJF15993.1 hydrolase [Couchioplanes caeruleus subsp. caeruleus]ROP27850.1 pimeloyl-ACP methyl ester carboxylesterase [Couchioplanes caeruleus]
MIQKLTVGGATIRVHDTGDPDQPPILLLHGIGRSLEDWLPQHDRLSGRWRVISVDLPGFGLSDRMPGPISLAWLAEGVLATVDTLGERRPLHVMGNSLGGAVAMQLLTAAPDRVSTLTLVNSAGFGKEVAFFLRALAIPGLGRPLMRRIDARMARRIERAIFHDRIHATQERVDFALQVAARPEYAMVFLETAQALGGLRGIKALWRQTLLAEVARHPRPTLLVWGDRDLILPCTHLAAARVAFPDARSHMFPDTGHMPQIERPDEFADLAELFLTARSDIRA